MKRVLSIFKKNKKVTSLSVVLGAMMAIGMSAMAADVADDAVVTAMTSSFGNVKATGIAALAAIGAIAIVLFGGIYAWKYGKKVFSIIAK